MIESRTTEGSPPLVSTTFSFDLDGRSSDFPGEAPAEGGDPVGVAPERDSAPAVLISRPDDAWHVNPRPRDRLTFRGEVR